MDLLVMENLFHNREITNTYDLKGIGKSILLMMNRLTR